MQITPDHATASQRAFPQEPGDRGVGIDPLTPAERIVLTIALLNRGLDLMEGVARRSLARCGRVAVRDQHDSPPARHSHRTT